MKKNQWLQILVGLVILAAGVVAVVYTREAAISGGDKTVFSMSLILAIIGLLVAVTGALPQRKTMNVKTLTMAAMFAALCYVGFAFFQIKIPVGDSATSFHLGNVFCVLAALCIGGVWGGLAGAVGMTIGDLLDPVYITSAPKTFLLKLCIGLITGFVAHTVFRLSRNSTKNVPMLKTVLSCAAGMAFNVLADPLVGYFYKMYVLGVPQDAATILAKMSAATTAVNAVVAVIAATTFYLALRPALKRTNLLPQL